VGGDPVNFVDPSGRYLLQLAGGLIGAGAQAYANYAAFDSGKITGAEYALSIGVGFGVGVLTSLGVGVGASALAGAIGGGITEGVNVAIGAKCFSKSDLATSIFLGAIAGGIAAQAGKFGNGILRSSDSVLGESLPLAARQTLRGPFGAVGSAIGSAFSDLPGPWLGADPGPAVSQ